MINFNNILFFIKNHSMKSILIFLIFILINTSLQSSNYLQRNDNITVSSSDSSIIFNSSSFKNNEIIYFEFKAESLSITEIEYLFFNEEETLYSGTYSQQSVANTYNREERGKNYVIKTFKITKSSGFKYLALKWIWNGEILIKNTKDMSSIDVSSSTDSSILKKYKDITVHGYDGFAIMDSSEFKEGDEIYIKVKATYFYDNYLYYDFTDNLQTYTPSYLFEDYLYEF